MDVQIWTNDPEAIPAEAVAKALEDAGWFVLSVQVNREGSLWRHPLTVTPKRDLTQPEVETTWARLDQGSLAHVALRRRIEREARKVQEIASPVDWDRCPVCRKETTQAMDGPDVEGVEAFQNVYCTNCEAMWTETYQAIGRERIVKGPKWPART